MNSSSEHELPKFLSDARAEISGGSDTGSRTKGELRGKDDYSDGSIEDILAASTEMREMTQGEIHALEHLSERNQKGLFENDLTRLPDTSDVDINVDVVREKVTDVIVPKTSTADQKPKGEDKPNNSPLDRSSQLESDLRITAKNFALRKRSATSSKLHSITMLGITIAPNSDQLQAFQAALTELVSKDWFDAFKNISLKTDDFHPKYTSVISHYGYPVNMHAFVILMFRLFGNMELSYAEYLTSNQQSSSDSSKDLIDSSRSGSDSSNNISSPKGYTIALIRCFAYVFQRIKIREKNQIHPDSEKYWNSMNRALFLS